MHKSRVVVLISLLTVVASPAFGTIHGAQLARMEACFRAHGYLMEKPGVRNISDCWLAHSDLMRGR